MCPAPTKTCKSHLKLTSTTNYNQLSQYASTSSSSPLLPGHRLLPNPNDRSGRGNAITAKKAQQVQDSHTITLSLQVCRSRRLSRVRAKEHVEAEIHRRRLHAVRPPFLHFHILSPLPPSSFPLNLASPSEPQYGQPRIQTNAQQQPNGPLPSQHRHPRLDPLLLQRVQERRAPLRQPGVRISARDVSSRAVAGEYRGACVSIGSVT